MIAVKGGQVLTRDGWLMADVLLNHSRVVDVDVDLTADTIIDATGCLVGPGLVDLHTHLREPGQTWKEDVESGSEAAAAGGFTAVVAMPNTDPPLDSPKAVEAVMAAGRRVGLVDVHVGATLTSGRSGLAPADIDALYRSGVRIFTDDGDSVLDEDLMRQVCEVVSAYPGAIVAQHAEDATLTAGGQIHQGTVARELEVSGLPTEAETGIVSRDLVIVAETGVRYHCQHVSAAETVDLIRDAKAAGVRVTAEVTPHHLTFDERSLATLDTNFKMYPPLRSERDRVALIAGLRDGTIDAIATDHAPHLPAEKEVPFDEAPRGVIGLETAASAAWEVLDDPYRLFTSLSIAPASIAGLSEHGNSISRGVTANLVVFDPGATWEPVGFSSKSSNSPYIGRTMRGRVRATVHNGRVVFRDGSIER